MAFNPSAPYAATAPSGASRAFDPSAPFSVQRPLPKQEEKDEFPTLRAVADVPLGLAQGFTTTVRNISDAFGANNEFSQNVRGIEDLLGEYMSAQYRKDAKAQQEILAKAEGKGVLANLGAAWEYLKVAPVDTITNLVGASAPYVIASLAGGPVTGAALGAVGGAGTIKGAIYDTVKEELTARTDLSPEDIEQRAQAAQAYNGENLDQIIFGAGLGAVAGSTGLESGMAKLLSRSILKRIGEKEVAAQLAKKTTEKMAETGVKEGFIEVGGKSFKNRLVGGALREAVPEAFQEGQVPLAQNIAMQREGYDVPTTQGVVQAAVLGGTLGALTGGPFEAAFGKRPTRIAVKKDAGAAAEPTVEVPGGPTGEAPVEPTGMAPRPDPEAPVEPTVKLPAAGPVVESPTAKPVAGPAAGPAAGSPTAKPVAAKPAEPYLNGDPLDGPHTDLPVFALPKNLAGAKPKYSLPGGLGSFTPVFFNDIDKALYIVSGTQKSSKDTEYRDFLKTVGFTDPMINTISKDVKNHIKNLATLNKSNGFTTGAIPVDLMRRSPVYQKIIAAANIPEAPKPPVAKPPAAASSAPIAAPTQATAQGPSPTKASVPFMMTAQMRASLANLGYTPEAIKNMKPEEAQSILAIAGIPTSKGISDPIGVVTPPTKTVSTGAYNRLRAAGYTDSQIKGMTLAQRLNAPIPATPPAATSPVAKPPAATSPVAKPPAATSPVAKPPAATLPPVRDTTKIDLSPLSRSRLEDKIDPGIMVLLKEIQKGLFPNTKFTLYADDTNITSLAGRYKGPTLFGDPHVVRINIETIQRAFSAGGKTKLLHTLMHEFSHAIEVEHYQFADAATKKAVEQQFFKERSATGFQRYLFYRAARGDASPNAPDDYEMMSALGRANLTEAEYKRLLASEQKLVSTSDGGDRADVSDEYYRRFEEWVAEKGAQWLSKELEGRVPKTVFEKFQKDVLDSLRDMYNKVARIMGIVPTDGAFEKMLSDVWGKSDTSLQRNYIEAAKKGESQFIPDSVTKSFEKISKEKSKAEKSTDEEPTDEESTDEESTDEEPTAAKPATVKPTAEDPAISAAPPTLRDFANTVTRPNETDSWFAKSLAELTGQEKIVVNGKLMYEPVGRALLRNTVAANLPFLERPEFRQVGRLIERVQNMQGRVVGMIKYGALSYNPETQEFSFDESTGGLKDLFEKAGVGRQAEIQALTVAMREYDLRKANRVGLAINNPKTGKLYTTSELKSIIDSADPVLMEVAANYRKFNNKMLKFALDTGIITKEQSEAFLSMMYTPFYRKQDESLSKDSNLVLSPAVQSALNDPQQIKDFSPKLEAGSFLDPNFYESVFKNYSSIVTMGLKNVAYSSVAKVGLEVKDKTLMEAVGKPGENTITYRVGGDEKHIRVNDTPMFQALAALSPKQLQGWMKVFIRFTELLRLGVTSMPGFQIANLWRGLIDTHIKTGMPLFELATETFKLMGTGFNETMKNGWLDNSSYRAIVAQTGFGGYNIGSRAKDQSAYLLRQYAKNEGTTTFAQGVQNVVDRLEEIGELSEMAPRIAYFNYLIRSKDKGGRGLAEADAAYEAMNLVNFSRSGTGRGAIGSFVAHMLPLVPFLNARIQGLYRLIESNTSGSEEAFGVKFEPNKGAYGIQKAIMMRGLMLLTFEIALQSMFGDEDWYDKLSIQDRVANNYVKVGDTIIALPRAFELGSLFGAIPSLLIDSIRKNEPKEFMEGFMHILGTTFSFNAIPQAVKPLVDVYYANRDSFTGQDIETTSEQKRPENERIDEYTSEVAKVIAKGVPNMSPKQADALLRGYLGTFGSVFTGTVDAVLSSGGTRPEGYFGDPTSFVGAGANALGLNRFLKTEKTIRNDYVSKFYDVKRTVEEITASIKDAHEAKDIDLVRQKLSDDPKAIGLNRILNRAESNINDINKQMKNIRNNPNMDADKKREYLNLLRDRKAKLSEQIYGIAKKVGYT